MNKFESCFFSIVVILVLSNIILVCVLGHDENFFSENLYFNVPLLREIDRCKLEKLCMGQDDNRVFLMQKKNKDIQDYFFHCMFMSFGNSFVIFSKFLDIFSLDKVIEKINDCKKILVNKLMYWSFCKLNSDLIENTTIVLELKSGMNVHKIFWVIQLGAFKNFGNVLEVVNLLKKHNYPVYISPEYPKFGEFIRVFVGPYSSKKNLECILSDLYCLTHLSGRIYFFHEYLK